MRRNASSEPTLREFARLQTAILLRRLAFEINRTGKNVDDAAVHDLRVAIRRFSRALRVFAQFYPDGQAKKIRRRLSELIEAAGGVRDRDIALMLLAEARVPPNSALAVRVANQRRQAVGKLAEELRRFRTRNLSSKWRNQLELEP